MVLSKMSFLEDTKYTLKKTTLNCSCCFRNELSVSIIMIFKNPFPEYTKYTFEKVASDLKSFFQNGLFVSKNASRTVISKAFFAYEKVILETF